MIRAYFEQLPLIAILRGLRPEDAVGVGRALVDAGFRILEVPLNSSSPMESIRRLVDAFGSDCLIGAGTVLDPAHVREIAAAGGRLVVMPHGDPAVISAAKLAGMVCTPGVATPTEGFAALAAGADAIKLFPAEQLGPSVIKAWRAVFPRQTLMIPVGGITPDNLATYAAAGADGFGLGSALYAPGRGAEDVSVRARAFVEAWRRAASSRS
ncbi:2-dehydro-3-deoxy-6-phosphogalactonate aldolase [Vitiosangium sp. GDMCC 1.1324]|uniref:2-dehydro-3-deoxy-6-phosphogalactonate aldolase n=1 Tax=Vitiosangium sp. (strain GDMCC 1.1324) TaxID=2138576 RepID=UPI000D338B62|nr:2-dehydro-3-deoxy-6-phosphogalactonate aldolase [Vitiosangium sp. GDMCC 1.1324]PTL85729.1 2-dehydro-3-deoxy-6-phosphogalactonate aldolase [Vitiosangium sp. GDMCC 1.1324]